MMSSVGHAYNIIELLYVLMTYSRTILTLDQQLVMVAVRLNSGIPHFDSNGVYDKLMNLN